VGAGRLLQEPLWAELGGLQVPVMLVAGGLDCKFLALHQQMLGAMAGAHGGGRGSGGGGDAPAPAPAHRLVEVPGCGHAVHEEGPQQLVAELQAFLGAL
jgi:isochorismate synthase/2-succinyl-5-enolpyruvyl-6-hydroxy-3-cyclohexene-1-carboxylate synthase/2-succinyl-6-hydroxy-2,4-cyclohexadiene-1-carboxylate synthase/O-succinylbenzoate synthase